jgi:hypothetical protein
VTIWFAASSTGSFFAGTVPGCAAVNVTFVAVGALLVVGPLVPELGDCEEQRTNATAPLATITTDRMPLPILCDRRMKTSEPVPSSKRRARDIHRVERPRNLAHVSECQ